MTLNTGIPTEGGEPSSSTFHPRAVLAVGNRLRGDDAVGPLIADELKSDTGLRVFDAGLSPENYIGPIVELNPDAVLIIDACDFGGDPGEYRLCGRDELARLSGGSVSTHTLPLSLTVALLEQQTPASLQFLAIQPGTVQFDAELSEPVRAALPELVELVRRWSGVSNR